MSNEHVNGRESGRDGAGEGRGGGARAEGAGVGGAGGAGGGEGARSLNFIEQIVEADAASGRWGVWPDGAGKGKPRVHTRFPPEPNGYLHIGHAKSINLNFGLAKKYGGKFNLRFDDTNPEKEEQEYVDSIIRDVKWLGGEYDAGPHAGGLYYASDYFEKMYEFAEELIQKGLAYVCELSADEVSTRRGTPSVPATSPFRDRSAEESLRLFREMRAGKHANGVMTLRAKIDLASPNFNLRDPVIYRILHEEHQHTKGKWCIYPMYDWAHGFEDSLEGVTHSICTLEFENHRPLYDWFINAVNQGRGPGGAGAGFKWGERIHHPQQIEFAKFRPTYTVLSKRNLLKMVTEGVVRGWDDPRMPTISGLRRRGFTAEAIRKVCEDVGVSKVESYIDLSRIEGAVRDHLNKVAPRAMGVLRPLRVTITNWPREADGSAKVDMLDFVVNPEDPGAGTRKVRFTGSLFIEREDFAEVASKGFFRLAPGQEVRLRWAYFITCTGVKKDAAGNVEEVLCTHDPATRGGDAPAGPAGADGKPTPGRKPKGTLHWVDASTAIDAEVRLIDRLFSAEFPGERTGNWQDDLNPRSMEVVRAKIEPHVAATARYDAARREGGRFQFERLGYFTVDADSPASVGGVGPAGGPLVLNRTVTLKDSAKEGGAGGGGADGKPKAANVRIYTLAEAALDLKVKAEKMPAVLAHAAAAVPGVAGRTPVTLTLDEFRKLKEYLKANPMPKG